MATDHREPLLQSVWWERFKCASAWSATRADSGAPLVLNRRLGPVTLAYAPHAFGSEYISLHDAVARLSAVSQLSDVQPTLIRWDVPWQRSEFAPEDAQDVGLREAPVRVQPPDTVRLDLSIGSEVLLGEMKAKTRYNVRLAERKGVAIARCPASEVVANDQPLQRWYAMYQETAQRDRITIHPYSYYRAAFEHAEAMRTENLPAPVLSLYTAYHDDDVLGGIIVASWDGESTYLYGASSNTKRNLMANYLLQWRAIEKAIEDGDLSYDFFGIPPTDDASHPMHGLYRFKTGFGGQIVHRPGCWDILLKPISASAYRGLERLRQWYYHDLRKRGSA